MSAYPFGALTWSEMRELLIKDHGVAEERIDVPMPGGATEQMVYLKRLDDKKKLHCHPFPILYGPDEMLSAPVIRNICKSLKISPKPFGLPLG
jgi:hypothetical protein